MVDCRSTLLFQNGEGDSDGSTGESVLCAESDVSPGGNNWHLNGVKLPVYDRERTICDCFKYRTKLDNEIFNKAVNAYVADEKKNLANLSKYAKEMGVYKKMMSVMEVLLNG